MREKTELVISPETLNRLGRRSDSKGLVQLCGHLSLLLISGIALGRVDGSAWSAPLLLVYGTLLTSLFAPLHECIHYTAFKSRWLNDTIAVATGFLLLIPFRYFRAFHYGHHRHTQDPQLDPELIGKKPWTAGRYWLHISGLPFWWDNAIKIYQHALGRVAEDFIEPAKHRVIINEARFHLLAYALLLLGSLFFSSSLLWWYWVMPALLTQPLLRLFLLAEHSGCDFGANMLQNSRTTYASPLLNFLSWNMPYHAEHHYLASIPFHALPALHAYTGQQIKFKGDGYYRVNRDIAAQI